MAVDREHDATVVDEHIVDLRRSGRRTVGRVGYEMRDLARLVRIAYVVGANAGVEEGAEHEVFRAPGALARRVLVAVWRAAAATLGQQRRHPGYRQGSDADQVFLIPRIDEPHELRPVLAIVLHRFVGHDE